MASTAAANGKQLRSKANKDTGSSKVSAAPAATPTDSPEPTAIPTTTGKPDKAAYDAEQLSFKSQIDALQPKLNAIKDKIGLTSRDGPGSERRKVLRAELDSLKDQQANSKNSRGKTHEQLKALQETISKKVKDLQAAKLKHPFKTVADVDAHVKKLEAQIDTGNMKLAEEKRALQEISQVKRARRTIEGFDKEQSSIDADRAQADEIRKQLDDPQAKAASERYEAIKAELDNLKKEEDEAYASRNKLFEERNSIKAEIDALYTQKKESAQRYKDSNDRYWLKVNEDRARRAEKFRQQKANEEAEKKKEIAERLREEAALPAFEVQIQDCQTLIDYFLAKGSGGNVVEIPPPSLSNNQSSVAGVAKLELRQVEDGATSGLIARKKKGEDDENYFVGSKGKKKGSRGPNSPATPTSTTGGFNLQLGILTALLEMSIPTPSSHSDIPRVIEDLRTKKAWFEANQDRTTAENIAKAEKDIQRLTHTQQQVTNQASDITANGKAESSLESTTTTSNNETSGEPSTSTEVSEKTAVTPTTGATTTGVEE